MFFNDTALAKGKLVRALSPELVVLKLPEMDRYSLFSIREPFPLSRTRGDGVRVLML